MPKGKPWTSKEEKKLRRLADSETPLRIIAAELGRTEGAIREKAKRLGVVVYSRRKKTTTSDLKIPETIKSLEEVLKILTGTLDAASQKGLDNTEIQRLQVIATIARTYETIFANYVNYRQIEIRLKDLEANYARLARKKIKSNAAR